jgi:hypothetical protein
MMHSRTGGINRDLFATTISGALHVTVELGMGDGRVLEKLAKTKTLGEMSLYIGIEKDADQYSQALSRINLANVWLINSCFEDIVPLLPDSSIDCFLAVLPDPDYIDLHKSKSWDNLYRILYFKLKHGGLLQIITEITNDLFEPVKDAEYNQWVLWLRTTFESMGFKVTYQLEGAPAEYSSRCLDQFRGGGERIRMVTLVLVRP